MKKPVTYTILILGVLALSTSAIFVRLANAPAAITAFYRLGFALLVLTPMVFLSKKHRGELIQLTKKEIGISMIAGSFLAIHYIMWFESLNYTSVASSTVIVTLQPVFSMLFAYLFLKERQPKLAILGCIIALAGSFLIGYGDFGSSKMALIGDIIAFVAAAIISGYFLLGQMIRRYTSALVYTMLAYFGSVLFLGAYALVKGDSFIGYSSMTWKYFLGLALISTIMGQFVFNLLLKYVSATTISMSILGEPVGTCILAYLILQESIVSRQGMGIVVIMGGLLLYFIATTRKKEYGRNKKEAGKD